MYCAACGNTSKEAESKLCPICGFPLAEAAFAKVKPELEDASGSASIDAPMPSSETEDLLKAFHQQFVERRVVVPEGWSRRLEQLARETEEGRRYATVIFVDLVGYTELSQVLPEMRLIALRNWFSALCTAEVERFGGFLIQLLGDAAFAAFGAPWAFERDSEAAVRCLLSIREKVREAKEFDGRPLAIRGGAASGIINVGLTSEGGRLRPDLIGSPVNLAARMQSRAEVFEIIIPKPLAELVRPAFELEEHEPFTPRNYGQVVTPYAVLGERHGSIERRRHDIPFVGRSAEMEQALSVFRSSTGTAAGGVLAVKGEAGIGKTRFARECLGMLVPPDRLFHAQLEPHHRHAILSPFVQLVSWLAGGEENPPAMLAALRSRFPTLGEATMRALGVLVHDETCRKAMAHTPPKELRAAVEAGILDLLAHAGKGEPLALLLDDLQWSDPLSLEFVERLCLLEPEGIPLVLIQRPEEAETRRDVAPVQTIHEIKLETLGDEERRELLGCLLDLDAVNPLVRDHLLEESGGVPLYLVELAAAADPSSPHSAERLVAELVESRSLDDHQRLIEIFQARIDRLTAQQRLTLQCGAIIGRRFRESMLSGIEELREELLEYLAFLKGARMLSEEDIPRDRELRFAPPLLRDVAYQMIAAKHRPELHRRFARMIAERYAERIDEFAAELANHWLKAGEFGEAVKWVRQACQECLRFGVPQQAYALAISALDQAPSQPGDALGVARILLLHEQAAIAAFLAGDYEASLRHLDHLERGGVEQGNPVTVFNARYRRALVYLESRPLDEAAALLLTLAPNLSTQQSRHDDLKAKIAIRRGDHEAALELFLAAAEREDQRHAGLAGDNWSNAALCLQRLGRLSDAMGAFERARAAYQRYGNPFGMCLVLNNVGVLHQHLGDFTAGGSVYEEALKLAESSGYIHGCSALAANVSYLRYLEGKSPLAMDAAARALNFARQLHHPGSEAIALINLGLAYEQIERLDEAFQSLDRALAVAVEHGYTMLVDECRVERAWVRLRQGRSVEGMQELAKVRDDLSADLAALRDRLRALAGNTALPPMPDGVSESGKRRAEMAMETLSRA